MQLEFLTLDFTSGSNNTITLSAVDHVGNELSSSPQLSVNVPQGINHFQRFENLKTSVYWAAVRGDFELKIVISREGSNSFKVMSLF